MYFNSIIIFCLYFVNFSWPLVLIYFYTMCWFNETSSNPSPIDKWFTITLFNENPLLRDTNKSVNTCQVWNNNLPCVRNLKSLLRNESSPNFRVEEVNKFKVSIIWMFILLYSVKGVKVRINNRKLFTFSPWDGVTNMFFSEVHLTLNLHF